MIRNKLLILFLLILLSFSCTGRKNKTEHKNIIPEKDLVSILTDVHLADGLFTLPKIRYMYSERDTLAAYNDIFEKYGYDREAMERTMRYYFIQRPKRFIKVYDQVLGILSEMESRLDKVIMAGDEELSNLWKGEKRFSFPDPDRGDSAWFNIPLTSTGFYTIRFTLTLYPDDETINPRPGLFIIFPDSTRQNEREYFRSVEFIKDGLPHVYFLNLFLKESSPSGIQGWFIDLEGQDPALKKHYRIENIHILCSPV